ncbi:MAG: DUF3612 domain-containing protein [Gammaproteobacteria bacterium]|nr:DUF3612 domain-containing protein [Gammaproteobacteria bacterium]
MKYNKSIIRKSHFLGTKIRNLRKRNHLTMEDLSARCIKINPEASPSVSYLSMIERGKRFPSIEMLNVIAIIFQKEVDWFLDSKEDEQDIAPQKGNRGGITGMALEPSFLFSNEILQIAIPEMLSQTGTTGREFAHLLIRAHQEHNQNHFPDLERAAEQIGYKQLPLGSDQLLSITKNMGMTVKWFKTVPDYILKEIDASSGSLVSSYFEPSNTIYLNELLKSRTTRMKYDLAIYIAHNVLHNKDVFKSNIISSINQSEQNFVSSQSSTVDAQDILYAWRDFECSFFAGALLCPKVPFRQLLDRHGYAVTAHRLANVSASVAMRRMTAVSPYPHWHYFDAYAPGKLKAVYRGNGIPLPWGNMRKVEDPCQHWAVFRMINSELDKSSSQISILTVGNQPRIYCCDSVNVKDLAENKHVLCAGIDLNPAIEAQGHDAVSLANDLKEICSKQGGSAAIPKNIKKDLMSVARILNISWVESGIESNARLICSRGSACPRDPGCYGNNN